MIKTARPAHIAGAVFRPGSRALWVTALSLALGLTAPYARAESEPTPNETVAPLESPPSTTTPTVSPSPVPSAEPEPTASPPEPAPAEPESVQPSAASDVPSIDETNPTEVEPLNPRQTAAWWTMFSAFAVGTSAGVLAGLVERQEDRMLRLASLYDSETGAQPQFAARKDEFERYQRRGEGFARAAVGVGIAAGLTAIVSITLFALDLRHQRRSTPGRSARRRTIRPRITGAEVRF